MADYFVDQLNYRNEAYNEGVFERFYTEYRDKIYNYVYFKVGNNADVEDLASRIMVKVLDNMGRYDEKAANLNTWIFTIARNQIIDYYRLKKNKDTLFEEGEDLNLRDEITPTPEDAVVKEEREVIIAGLLQELPENEREILSLKFWGGLKNIEISEQLGISANNVNVIVFRSLRKLKDKLEERKIDL